MNTKLVLFLQVIFIIVATNSYSQDTFSIVAVDPITGEVGSAGASCVNLFQTGLSNDDFLGELLPNVGAINTQAYYIPANQDNAMERMYLGETPSEIIAWLVANDINSEPELRQYGIVALIDGSPQTAAHTGASTDDYKNHITGSTYSIQGNILLGQQVLDSMEARFLNEPGDLACKLMAALQGANMIGADTRCEENGTSSLFAFVKVAQPTDQFGSPSFLASVRTADNDGIEPIDSLQTIFETIHNCSSSLISEPERFEDYFSVYPNPAKDQIHIVNKTIEPFNLHLIDSSGRFIHSEVITSAVYIDTSEYSRGMYTLRIENKETVLGTIFVLD